MQSVRHGNNDAGEIRQISDTISPRHFFAGLQYRHRQCDRHGQGGSHVRHVAVVDDRGLVLRHLFHDLRLRQIHTRHGTNRTASFP